MRVHAQIRSEKRMFRSNLSPASPRRGVFRAEFTILLINTNTIIEPVYRFLFNYVVLWLFETIPSNFARTANLTQPHVGLLSRIHFEMLYRIQVENFRSLVNIIFHCVGDDSCGAVCERVGQSGAPPEQRTDVLDLGGFWRWRSVAVRFLLTPVSIAGGWSVDDGPQLTNTCLTDLKCEIYREVMHVYPRHPQWPLHPPFNTSLPRSSMPHPSYL